MSVRATSCRSLSITAMPGPGGGSPTTSTRRIARRFGHADPAAPIEIVGFGATAIGKVDAPELPTLARGGRATGRGADRQPRVFFEGRDPGDAGDWGAAQVLARDKLLAGNKIAGPAVIEEISATTVLYPGDRAEVHASGVLLVECPT